MNANYRDDYRDALARLGEATLVRSVKLNRPDAASKRALKLAHDFGLNPARVVFTHDRAAAARAECAAGGPVANCMSRAHDHGNPCTCSFKD